MAGGKQVAGGVEGDCDFGDFSRGQEVRTFGVVSVAQTEDAVGEVEGVAVGVPGTGGIDVDEFCGEVGVGC